MLTLQCGALTGGPPQEVLHITEKAAARQRHSSQMVKPALYAPRLLAKNLLHSPQLHCMQQSEHHSHSDLAALEPHSAQHRLILSSRVMLSSTYDGAFPSLLAVQARQATSDPNWLAILLQVAPGRAAPT